MSAHLHDTFAYSVQSFYRTKTIFSESIVDIIDSKSMTQKEINEHKMEKLLLRKRPVTNA